MKKRASGTVLFSILLLLILYSPASAGGIKTAALEEKIYEISSLRAKIIDKIDQAVEMRTRLERQLADLREEIRSEQIRNGTIGQTGDDQPDAVVETFACNINEGSDMEDVIAAEEYWRGRVDALNSPAVNQFEAQMFPTQSLRVG